MNGTVISPKGTAAIAKTPNNLFGNTRNKLNVGKKYHSGKISKGVLNGSAGSPICVGAKTDNPTIQATVPNIVNGKMYKISFGHAGLKLDLHVCLRVQRSVPEPYVRLSPYTALQ